MASGDFYVDPAGRYVNVYPISTRRLPVGFFFLFSFGPSPTWPPEDDPNGFVGTGSGDAPGKQLFVSYIDDRDDLPGSGDVEASPGIFYNDNFTTSIVGLDVAADSYGVMQSLWFWDLSGLPVSLGQVERAEMVTEIQVHPALLSGERDLLLTWKNSYTEPFGFEVGPDDFTSNRSGNAARISTQTLLDANAGNGNPYQDTASFDDPDLVAWWGSADNWDNVLFALPLDNLDQLRTGLVGLAYTLDAPSKPANGTEESLNFFGFYGDYDSLVDEHGLHVAAFRLPFLRLWLPEVEEPELPVVDVAGEITIGLEIGGALSVDAGPPVFHRAKLLRGY